MNVIYRLDMTMNTSECRTPALSGLVSVLAMNAMNTETMMTKAKTSKARACMTLATATDPPVTKRQTKQDAVIALLRTDEGATITSISAATSWQPHSVRGFLAGVVRKKLGLTLVSAQGADGRIYRIDSGSAA
jgi:hypothetical protein